MHACKSIRKNVFLFSALLVMWTGLSAVDAPNVGPQKRVEAAVSQILSTLRTKTLSREQRWEEIGRVIDQGFDFRSMSQSVLATSWKDATPEEKRRFVEYFSQYLEDTYRSKIELYTDERVDYVRETITGPRAVVDTVIVTDKTRIPVSYKLKVRDGEWFAYDVIIEGVSLVNNYRNTFAAIVKAEGIDGLLSNLQGKIDTYKRDRDANQPRNADETETTAPADAEVN